VLQQEMEREGGCLHTNLLAIHSEGVVADPLAAGWIWVFLVWDLGRFVALMLRQKQPRLG